MTVQDYIVQSWVRLQAIASPIRQRAVKSAIMRGSQQALGVQTLLKKRATVSQSVEQQQQAASISEPLRRCLGSVDVLFLGLGSILGAGCFVLTGLAAHDDAG